jgi:membrane protein required for colicin V production
MSKTLIFGFGRDLLLESLFFFALMDLEYSHFNAFDLLILVTLGFSILIGFSRGFVRELFGLGAWGGAGFMAMQKYAWPEEFLAQWIHDPKIAQPASMFLVFLIALILFLCIAQWLSLIIQESFAQTIDRSLGLVFGFFRGIFIICAVYMGALILFSAHRVPAIVSSSKSVIWLNRGVVFMEPLSPKFVRTAPLFMKNIMLLKPAQLSADDLTQSLAAPTPAIQH